MKSFTNSVGFAVWLVAMFGLGLMWRMRLA